MKVFLGGTCNGSKWREAIIPHLEIEYFNPVVPNWTEEAYQQELKERENCDYCLYVITPLMTGVYSIAEAVDDSNKRPSKVIFCYIKTENKQTFSPAQIKSLDKTGAMIEANGGKFLTSLKDVISVLNAI